MRATALLALILGIVSAPSPASSVPVNKGQPAVNLTILFFTASWCEPCHAVQPILEKFTHKHPKEVQLVLVDFDSSPDEAARWHVHRIPAVILLSKGGKIVLRADGADRETLRVLPAALEDAVKSPRARS